MRTRNTTHVIRAAFTALVCLFVTFGAFAEQAENNSVDNNENSLSEKDAVPFKDPFWPIGFRPISPDEPSPDEITQAVVMEDMWNEALEKISVKGVFKVRGKDGKVSYAAIINNATVRENQVLRVNVKDTIFRIRVKSISMEEGVKLERLKDD